MKISKSRIKQLISESIERLLSESDEERKSSKDQNEIYKKVSPLIISSKEEDFNSGFTLLAQLVTMESEKIKTEEAIKEMAEDLFKKIKEIPLSIGNRNLEDEASKLYNELMKIERRDGQAGTEYYTTLAMYNDAEEAFRESSPEPLPEAIELHQRLEKVLSLIGLSSPSFVDIYGTENISAQSQNDSSLDDEYSSLLDDIDYEEFDYDVPDPSYDGSSDDDDWLY